MPCVSVIIPTTRRPLLVERAVISVLAQTFLDFEIIIVVDGPNAETTAVLSKIDHPNIFIIQNESPVGGAYARNLGVSAANGKWIAFLDDDDEWAADKLERQVKLAEDSEGEVIISSLSYVVTPLRRYIWPRQAYGNVEPLGDYLFDRRSVFRGEAMLQCSSLLMRRSFFLSLRFDRVHDDWDFLFRAVNHKHARILSIQRPLVLHYTEEARASLGNSFDWRQSLLWLENMRPRVSRRAYSGFCLTVISPQAAACKDYKAFFTIMYRAFRHGSPRLVHILVYLAIWLIPVDLRRRARLRQRWSSERMVAK